MKRTSLNLFILLLAGIVILSCNKSICKAQKKENNQNNQNNQVVGVATPPLLVYKTKADYFQYVPVTLSEDKTQIVSFPDIKDIYYRGKLAYPTKLNKGYLIDNRGINKNAAFLSITYEDYSKLEKTPSAEKLMGMLLDNDPLVELYDCGMRMKYKNPAEEINKFIDSEELNKFKKIK